MPGIRINLQNWSFAFVNQAAEECFVFAENASHFVLVCGTCETDSCTRLNCINHPLENESDDDGDIVEILSEITADHDDDEESL